jgi:RNA polymerase sigma-54 factor
MQLSQSMGLRLEQRQLLTPRMIQSMEILQLPLMALEERIEQELQNNPVLELRDGGEGDGTSEPAVAESTDTEGRTEDFSEAEKPMVVKENTDQSEDFERLAKISEYSASPAMTGSAIASSMR